VNFNSHADTVVRVAVALVNLLTPGEERGRAYEPPRAAALVTELNDLFESIASRSRATEADASDFAAVAARLRLVFAAVAAGDIDSAAREVNEILAATGAHPELERHDSEPWHVHFHATGPGLARSWEAGCATGLAIVLGGEHYDRLGACTAPRCDRVYVDTSRNGSKRFCSTACQNRVKAAAFRERRA
jgi:predicted RNA-binding Zn ribbon-like protein